MSAFNIIIGAVGVLATIWGAWGIFCNEKTYRQRLRLIEALDGERALYDAYWQVSYDQHCRALERFRDPFELYSPVLRAALNRKDASEANK